MHAIAFECVAYARSESRAGVEAQNSKRQIRALEKSFLRYFHAPGNLVWSTFACRGRETT